MKQKPLNKTIFGGFPGARFIGKEELASVSRVIGARSPYRFYGLELKRETEKLEKMCRTIFKRRYALAVSSGTAALHTALFSAGISKGDEVIIPAYGWIANLMSVLALEAVPVIVAVDENLGMDIASLKKGITKKTKAIVAVHMRGYPCDLRSIVKIGRRHKISIIEDGAQCIGGAIGKFPIGSLGDISILSFQYNKLLTSGEGGIVLTNNRHFYKRAYRFHDLGMSRYAGRPDPEGLGAISSFGVNYRLNELQSSFLIPQLKKMPGILKGLKASHEEAEGSLLRVSERFGLNGRRPPQGSFPNNAFLCLNAGTKENRNRAYKALRRLKVPVQKCSRLDGHHFQVWAAYMKREKRPFRLIDGEKTKQVLERNLFVEVNAGGR